MIKARILADSIGPAGIRLTTWELTYHRYIHSELMTYRMWSRNAASSRAIPIAKMRERIRREPAMPVHWGANQAGMQAHAELTGWRRRAAVFAWLLGCRMALFTAWMLMKLGVHKQIANRVTEPWMYITTIVTTDEFGLANMFHQRKHPDAQPEFRVLAETMWDPYHLSTPNVLKMGEWHLPLVYSVDRAEAERMARAAGTDPIGLLKAISVGRCARVSYLTHDGLRNILEDIGLHNRLKNADPGHWSPFEHVAMAISVPATIGNLHGWEQYRKSFPNENLTHMPAAS